MITELSTEGCWRKTGSLPRIKQLLLDSAASGDGTNFNNNSETLQFSVHDRCSAVKKVRAGYIRPSTKRSELVI